MSKPMFEDMFGLSGRKNRKSYALYSLALVVPLFLLWVVSILKRHHNAYVVAGVTTLPSLVLAFSSVAVASQRCRNFDWSGWAMLLALVPLVNVIFAVAILFVPGTDGSNRFGPDPRRAFANDWPENWVSHS